VPGLMFALGTVGFGEIMPLPVVFGAAPPAAGALGLPGAVAPGLPPVPVCANAAVVISAADTIATGIRVLADILRLLIVFRNFTSSSLSMRNREAARLFPIESQAGGISDRLPADEDPARGGARCVECT
jgi:hypothetical protein